MTLMDDPTGLVMRRLFLHAVISWATRTVFAVDFVHVVTNGERLLKTGKRQR
jgi:hypothetical protein